MQPLSRRRALQLSGLGLAGTVIGAGGLTWRMTAGFSPAPPAALTEPPTLTSTAGLLQVRLEAAAGPVRIAGRQATALAYNGGLPGPTLRLQPGDRLQVDLVNRLTQPTNLHVHGLHVSPQGNGDNPFVTVHPGASFSYDYQLPADHSPGVYWYHPHHHGTVADQVFGGLYGAIIVGDAETPTPSVPVTRERVLVISDISLSASGTIQTPSAMDRMRGREGELILTNGQTHPELTAQPGERERWRIVNACTSRYLRLRLDGQHLQLLGLDSGRFAAPHDADEFVLAPGNRADVLVSTTAGTSQLQTLPYNRGYMMGMGGGMGGGMGNNPQPNSNQGDRVLATLEVTGRDVTTLPAVAAQPEPRDLRGATIARRRELTFAMSMGGGAMNFTIDGQKFDADRVDQTVDAGTIEEWTVTNTSPMDHPLHLHVWPMQIIETEGQRLKQPIWQDVVNIPARSNVKVRVAFDDFAGRTVYHCHILDHEDHGMMGVINARS
ncbi:MAG: multicopper oxidase family protein [Propionibacteriaceae bacterium]